MEVNDTLILLSLTQAEINAITSPDAGSIVYNTTTNEVQGYNGSSWISLGSGGGGGGEVNTASNLGVTGEGVFAQKNGVDLEFKKLIGGSNVTLTPAVDNITIDVAGGSGEINTASNVGVGNGIFKQKTGVDLEFKSIDVGSGITATVFPDSLRLDLSNENKFFGRVETIDNTTNSNIEYFTEPQNSTEISTTATYTGGNYLVKISFIGRNTSQNGRLIVIPQVDSTDIFSQPYRREAKDNQDIFYETIQKIISLTAGVHSFQLQINRSGGGTSRVFEANINVEKYLGSVT